jgi:hypothetical protein
MDVKGRDGVPLGPKFGDSKICNIIEMSGGGYPYFAYIESASLSSASLRSRNCNSLGRRGTGQQNVCKELQPRQSLHQLILPVKNPLHPRTYSQFGIRTTRSTRSECTYVSRSFPGFGLRSAWSSGDNEKEFSVQADRVECIVSS